MIIYLARHGQTTGDVENRYGGDYEDHLTDEGKQQSTQLAEQLTGNGIEKLYASPRIRAQETAGIVGKKLDLSFVVLNDFRERNSYGVLTGLTKSEALEKYPDQIELLKDVHNAVNGAEEYQPFQDRITKALGSLSQEPLQIVAVIAHGGPMRLIFRDILQLGEIEVSDCAYAVLEAGNGQYKLLQSQGIVITQ